MNIDGLVQDCSNSIAYTLELLQSCIKSSMCQNWEAPPICSCSWGIGDSQSERLMLADPKCQGWSRSIALRPQIAHGRKNTPVSSQNFVFDAVVIDHMYSSEVIFILVWNKLFVSDQSLRIFKGQRELYGW